MLDEEGENDYLMKTVMRALHSAEEKILPITQVGFLSGKYGVECARKFSENSGGWR